MSSAEPAAELRGRARRPLRLAATAFALSVAQWDQACAGLQGVDLELIHTWYRRDDNAIPPVAVLQPRTGRFREPSSWAEVEDRLRSLLEPVIGSALSATEQEMRAGVLGVPDGSGARGPRGFPIHIQQYFRGFPQKISVGVSVRAVASGG